MSRFMSALWWMQALVLVVALVVLLAHPSALFSIVGGCQTVPTECVCVTDSTRGVGAIVGASTGASAGASTGTTTAAGGPSCCMPRGLCRNPADCCEVPPSPSSAKACAYPSCPSCDRMLAPDIKACTVIASDRDARKLFVLAQMLAPFLLAFALISLHAAMREDQQVRQSIASVFAAVYSALAVLNATGAFADGPFSRLDFVPRALLAALISLLLFSLFQALRPTDRGQRLLALLAAAAYGTLAALDLGGLDARTVTIALGGTFVLDTLLGSHERFRARLFTVVLLFPLLFAATDSLSGVLFSHRFHGAADQNFLAAALSDKPLASRIFLGLVVFGLLTHALYAVWPTARAAPRLSGTANTRPPGLWVLWLAQGFVFLAWAGLYLWGHNLHLWRYLFAQKLSHPGYRVLLVSLRAIYPPLLIAMALFSFSSMKPSREWLWKARCIIFTTFWAAVLLNLLFVWDGLTFTRLAAALALPPVILGALHIKYYLSHGAWFSEEVGEGPDGWVFVDLVLGPLMMLQTLLSGRRATHARGVAAWGVFRVLPQGQLSCPEHEFFQPGREFPLQMRFANERLDDDAAADARGAALRLSMADKSPFDLLLGTGAFAAAENVLQLGTIAVASTLGRWGRRWLAKDRRFLEGGIAALRRAPASYTQLIYHSQTVRFWVAQDNERYLVRYRLVPWPLPENESGLPVTRADYLDRRRSAKERRPTDYLRRELKMALESTLTATLRLQAQFHKISPGDGLQWYNPATDWDPRQHPWVCLAELILEDVLSDEDAERLCFNPDNAPSSLGAPVARSLTDYRSIADSERRVMRRVQSLRRSMNAAFGLPARTSTPID